jgi:hypothetical protein
MKRKVTPLTPPYADGGSRVPMWFFDAHEVLPCRYDSPMPMRFSHADAILRCWWGSALAYDVWHALLKFSTRSYGSGIGIWIRYPDPRCEMLTPVRQITMLSPAPDHHEHQPKLEFWTIFKIKPTRRKFLVSSMSDNFFSVVGACLEVLEGCEGWFSRFFYCCSRSQQASSWAIVGIF